MLRITTTETDERVTLKLEGKLSGPWAAELEQCWRTTSPAKRLVLDLSGVTFVDPAGKKVLCAIATAGGQLVGSGLVPKSLIDEICTDKSAEKVGKAKMKEVARLLLIVLLPLLVASPTRAQDSGALRLTLHEAVATALKENPQVQIATLSFAESQQDNSIARSALLPQAGSRSS